MHADIISSDMLSSPPNLASSLLSGMCFTFNLALMWLLAVHGPALSGTLPTVTNGWQVNERGMGLEVMTNQDGI